MNPDELQQDMKQHFENKSKSKSKVETNPLIQITKEISKRVEGQKDTIQFLTIMNAMSRHSGCKGTSGNVLLRSESGAGKDYIVREIRRPWSLDNNYQHIQKLTKEGITYVDNKTNPDFSYDGQVLHLEEVNGSTINNKSMLAFLSNDFGNKFSMKSVRDNKAQDEFVKGKPIILMTSSTLELDYDNLRRIKVWYLNVSDEQIEKALDKEIEIREKKNKVKIKQEVLDYLQELQQIYYDVHIPYARDLKKSFVKSFSGNLPTQAMTIFSFVLDFIGAVTILHHKVRDKDNNDRLIATEEDFEIAKPILAELFKKGIIPTLPNEEDIIEVLGNPNTNLCYHCNEVSCGDPNIYTIAEIRKELEYDVQYNTASRRLDMLMKKGLVTKHGSARCNNNNRKTTGYSVNGFSGFQQLALSIVNGTNENIRNIRNNENNEKIQNTEKTQQEGLFQLFQSFPLITSFTQLSEIAKTYVNIIQEEFSDKEFDSADLLTKYSELSQKDVNDLMEYFANKELIIEAGQGRFVFI